MMPIQRIPIGFLWKPLVATVLLFQIGGVAYVGLSPKRRMASRVHTRFRIHDVQEVLLHYGEDHADACPRSMDVLVAHRYITRALTDDWGTVLAFSCTSPYSTDKALVVSAGPDRKLGTADDIRSDSDY